MEPLFFFVNAINQSAILQKTARKTLGTTSKVGAEGETLKLVLF